LPCPVVAELVSVDVALLSEPAPFPVFETVAPLPVHVLHPPFDERLLFPVVESVVSLFPLPVLIAVSPTFPLAFVPCSLSPLFETVLSGLTGAVGASGAVGAAGGVNSCVGGVGADGGVGAFGTLGAVGADGGVGGVGADGALGASGGAGGVGTSSAKTAIGTAIFPKKINSINASDSILFILLNFIFSFNY
jgi:hypothetical protein